MINSAMILSLENPFAPWNPLRPVDWLTDQINWLTDQLFAPAGIALVWLLTEVPSSLGYLSYIVFAIWLTRWVPRNIPIIPLNPQSPMFYQPGGGRLWIRLGIFDLLLAIGGAGIGAYIPSRLADTI